MSLDRRKSAIRLIAGIGLLVAFTAFCVPICLEPARYMADDCYYYPQIAWHIQQGYGSTFNQITQTNGYHPLWMLA